MYLGVDLSPREQKRLAHLQERAAKLRERIGDAPPDKRKLARHRLSTIEEKIARLTQTEPPQPPTDGQPETLPVPPPPMTPVWIDPVSGAVSTTPPDQMPPSEPAPAAEATEIPWGYLVIGAVALMFMTRRRA